MKLKLLSIAALAVFLSGCSFFTEEAVPRATKAANYYCENVSPELRAVTRAEVNRQLTEEPGGAESITIVCAGDTQ